MKKSQGRKRGAPDVAPPQEQPDMRPREMTYEEAAKEIGVSARTVMRLVDKGEIVAKTLAGTRLVRIAREEVDRYRQNSPRKAVSGS